MGVSKFPSIFDNWMKGCNHKAHRLGKEEISPKNNDSKRIRNNWLIISMVSTYSNLSKLVMWLQMVKMILAINSEKRHL